MYHDMIGAKQTAVSADPGAMKNSIGDAQKPHAQTYLEERVDALVELGERADWIRTQLRAINERLLGPCPEGCAEDGESPPRSILGKINEQAHRLERVLAQIAVEVDKLEQL